MNFHRATVILHLFSNSSELSRKQHVSTCATLPSTFPSPHKLHLFVFLSHSRSADSFNHSNRNCEHFSLPMIIKNEKNYSWFSLRCFSCFGKSKNPWESAIIWVLISYDYIYITITKRWYCLIFENWDLIFSGERCHMLKLIEQKSITFYLVLIIEIWD